MTLEVCPPFSLTTTARKLSHTIGKAKKIEAGAEREDLLESAMSEQWRMPPAQGGLVVKRLARNPPRLHRTDISCLIVLYCILCHSASIRDWYCDASEREVIVGTGEDEAGVSFPQQQTATITITDSDKRAGLSFCSLLRLKLFSNCFIMSH